MSIDRNPVRGGRGVGWPGYWEPSRKLSELRDEHLELTRRARHAVVVKMEGLYGWRPWDEA